MIPILLLLCSAFVAMLEAAFYSMDPVELEILSKKGDPRARICIQLKQNTGEMLISFLILLNTLLIFYGITATLWVLKGQGVQKMPVLWLLLIPSGAVVIGEVVPKSIGVRFPVVLCLTFAPVLQAIRRILRPFTWMATKAITLLIPVQKETERLFPEAPFRSLLVLSAHKGKLQEEERKLIEGLMDFREAQAKDVMTPRVDMVALPVDSPLRKVVDVMIKTGHSRIPVYEENPDSIAGIIYAKDVLKKMWEEESWENCPAIRCMRPALFVPESKKISDIFAEMRAKNVHMAIVVDEFGGTAGLLTIEDLLEEIVGEIRDEYDFSETPEVKWLNEEHTEGLFSARMPLDELNQLMNTHIPPTEDYETIGGLIYTKLGRIPRKGDSLVLNELEFRVEEVRKHRIHTVRIRRRIPEQ
ncbi:MAG: hemolysin family protein [bacterium JZ-2024 1]